MRVISDKEGSPEAFVDQVVPHKRPVDDERSVFVAKRKMLSLGVLRDAVASLVFTIKGKIPF